MISPCGHDRCVHKGHHSCLPTLRPDGSGMTLTVNSLVPDLITIVPEPRQIDGNQQVLATFRRKNEARSGRFAEDYQVISGPNVTFSLDIPNSLPNMYT